MTPREIADFFEKSWFEKKGLAAALIVCAPTFPLLLGHAGIGGAALGTVVVWGAVSGLWYWTRQPETTPEGKIGFVISISCSDDGESKKLQEDFVRPLRDLLKSGRTGYVFHAIEIPQHIASRIQDVEAAQTLRIKCKAHFVIYGRVRLREISGKEVHILDLEGIVAHQPVPESVGNLLAREFSELMPRKIQIEKENDLLAFQFTSEWADLVSRYIIGLAAEISGDWDYAETLFRDARNRLHGKSTNFPIYQKLKDRLPLRISELSLARARVSYDKWAETKDSSFLLQCERHLGTLVKTHQEDRGTLNLRAILAFVLKRDVEQSIALLKRVKAIGQPLWHLNMAFLLGYKGELKNAIRHYRLAANSEADPETLTQVEDFIVWVLECEPEKYQLHYCLGFFNWQLKGDPERAIHDLNDYLLTCAPNSA